MRYHLVTLGCDKNTVDSERYLAQLAERGAERTDDLGEADVIIVNTCGFIDAAKKESIDAIVEAGAMKSTGACQAVVAVGCMVRAAQGGARASLPEVDLFLGASEMDRLIPELEARGLIGDPPELHPGRARSTPATCPHVRYLKISEGCDHGCAFCAIPLMRGKHRSFALDEVVREAQLLELQGAREVNLVAQDLAHYGRDRRDGITAAGAARGARARRRRFPGSGCSICTRAGITPRLLEVDRARAAHRAVSRHADPARVGRGARAHAPPGAAAHDPRAGRARSATRSRTSRSARRASSDSRARPTRTSQQLLEFLEEMQFDRVGAFTYSPQEGTRAFELRRRA